MITAGIDIGTRTGKAVLLHNGNIIASQISPINDTVHKVSARIFKSCLKNANVSKWKLAGVAATGYGARHVKVARKKIPSVACIAKAVNFQDENIKHVLDIGGLITCSIKIGKNGKVADYLENEKCASGCGRFLEMISDTLEIGLENIGDRSLKSNHPIQMSRQCIVFAESEIISYVNSGKEISDILAGLHRSIAERAVSLIKRTDFEPPITITGGVAKNIGVIHCLEKILQSPVHPIQVDPQLVGAMGAALLSSDS